MDDLRAVDMVLQSEVMAGTQRQTSRDPVSPPQRPGLTAVLQSPPPARATPRPAAPLRSAVSAIAAFFVLQLSRGQVSINWNLILRGPSVFFHRLRP
eukprot:2187976-Prorocentrum_lima.AAC.1